MRPIPARSVVPEWRNGGLVVRWSCGASAPPLRFGMPRVGGRSAARARTRRAGPGRCRVTGRPQARADFSLSARSVRSQEKPPSASGARPKWP
jgi:hypothetical protein